MTTYRERRQARADRLREWAEKRAAKSAAAFSGVRQIADAIPFGQPILVGHHSERRARRDQERIHAGMRRAIEHQDTAASMTSRADEIERQAERAIYDDDPDALERLRDKIAGLEARRKQIKAENAAHRKAHGAELRAIPSAYQRDQAMPHQAYELQNLAGNLTRCRQRLAQLERTRGPRNTDDRPHVEGETALARAGLTVTAAMTTPHRVSKKPRPVWNVTGRLDYWCPFLLEQGGCLWHGVVSFWEDPTDTLESALLALETPADVLPTGETQPRLPGDVGAVREQECPQPPIAPMPDAFALTPPAETQPTQTSLFGPTARDTIEP